MAVMINPAFHAKLKELSDFPAFVETTCQTETALEKQAGVELVLRFFAFRNVPYSKGMDVHEYLDSALIDLCKSKSFDMQAEEANFHWTFSSIKEALGESAFKKWDGNQFRGMFLMSLFEVIALGVSKNEDALKEMTPRKLSNFIKKKAQDLWENETFKENSGAGVRGTTRLAKLIPLAEEFFKA